MTTASQPAHAGTEPYYRWEPPDKNIAIHLSYAAANDILNDAIRGLGLVPRRGIEVGGILLGTAERGKRLVIRIEAALPVESEHAFGPSYVLSEADKQTLAAALGERAGQVMGFYRSHTRHGLALGDEDLALLSGYFPEPFQVALLVKAHTMQASIGGFFFREEGKIRSESAYLEFRFERTPAERPDGPAAETSETDTPPPAEVALPSFLQTPPKQLAGWRTWWRRPRHASRPTARVQPLWSSWWVQVPLLVVLLATDATIGFVVAQRYPFRLPASAAQEDPYSLHLLVMEYGNNLHLTWDRNAPALAQARRAMLTIVDGEQSRILELSPAQLHSGSVIYRRLTTRVRFRLEVFVRDRQSVAETWELGTQPGQAAGETTAELPKPGAQPAQ